MLDLGRSPHSLINTLGKESPATGITLLQQGPLPAHCLTSIDTFKDLEIRKSVMHEKQCYP